jgi:hypothetical protein
VPTIGGGLKPGAKPKAGTVGDAVVPTIGGGGLRGGCVASPTNAERYRGTAGAVAMGYRRQRGALARLSLSPLLAFLI